MTPERWQQVRELLHSAMHLDQGQREQYLAQCCSTDPSLRKDVDSLLAVDAELRASFLDSQVMAAALSRTWMKQAGQLAPGTRLGRYEILDLIGAGGMGQVYRARDTQLPRVAAIKVLPSDLSSDAERRQRLEREAHAIAALQHPHICTLYDVGLQDGVDFLVMEYLEGETLAERLQKGSLPFDQTLRIGAEVADALDAAHRRGVVHRDLKPGNVFITKHGESKLLDFGLAKVEEEKPATDTPTSKANPKILTTPGVAMGTVAYMSPEQARGEELDIRSDIFSFGAVLYEMATGRPAFPGKTSAIVFKAILDQEQVPPTQLVKELPQKLDEIIGRALEKDRKLRYQSAADLRADLQRLMRDSDSRQRLARPAPAEWQSIRRLVRFSMLLLIVSVSGILLYRATRKKSFAGFDTQSMTVTKLTDIGKIGAASISADGRYVAYALRGAQQSLWVRQVETESVVQLVPPKSVYYVSITFSPDSNYVYFFDREGSAYVIPVLGGEPRLVAKEVFSGIGVSPDGKKVAFVRGSSPATRVMIANRDGTGETLLTEHQGGIWFSSRAAPAWSSDGKLVAVAATRPNGAAIVASPVTGGKSTIIPIPYSGVASLSWLPDKSGLLTTGASLDSLGLNGMDQIWYQPFPGGPPQRVSNDVNGYGYLSLTADGKVLAATQREWSSTIYVAPAENPEKGRPISTARSDGIGLKWMPNGELLSQDLQSKFWLQVPDGKSRKLLFQADALPDDFSVCGGGSFVVFSGTVGKDRMRIWRVDTTGGNLQKLTNGDEDSNPGCSPDGEWLIYSTSTGSGYRLMKAPFGAGSAMSLRERPGVFGSYSPHGDRIATLEWDEKFVYELAILDSQSGRLIRKFPTPSSTAIPDNHFKILWKPDETALTYLLLDQDGTINIWNQPLASGPPQQLTHFPEGVIAFAWSPDGKSLAYTRATTSQDLVLFRFQ